MELASGQLVITEYCLVSSAPCKHNLKNGIPIPSAEIIPPSMQSGR